jgi:hypothetical protein
MLHTHTHTHTHTQTQTQTHTPNRSKCHMLRGSTHAYTCYTHTHTKEIHVPHIVWIALPNCIYIYTHTYSTYDWASNNPVLTRSSASTTSTASLTLENNTHSHAHKKKLHTNLVLTRSRASTTSMPSMTRPKTQCLPSR